MLAAVPAAAALVAIAAGACSASSDTPYGGGATGGKSGGDAAGAGGGTGGDGGTAGAGGSGGAGGDIDGGSGGAGTGGGPGPGGSDGAAGAPQDGPAEACTPGSFWCVKDSKHFCEADGGVTVTDCSPGTCDFLFGCVKCKPGTGTCNGNLSHRCLDDGSGWVDEVCDPVQGVTCDGGDGGTGLCKGECAPANLGESYIGCEYYPTVTGNEVDNDFDFAVAVSNTSTGPADVTIEGGAAPTPVKFTVPPGSAQVQALPWVAGLKACTSNGQLECGKTSVPAVLAVKGAYRLRSTRPVTVYQFNPLQYQKASHPGLYSYTNDASLLLPANALTGKYRVAAWPTWNSFLGPMPGLLAVTATQDATKVTVTTTAATGAGNGAPAFQPGQPGTVTMNRGDVLELFNYAGDLTGSYVDADKPVQVVGGHYCTQVPIGTAACDHIEESLFPLETLSDTYIVTSPALKSMPNGKVRIVRIVATKDGTTLAYDPPQAGAPATIATAGGVAQITNNVADFQIKANAKILVAEYMEGQDAGGGEGDPAMALGVAAAQYRKDYLFHSPTNYTTNYVNIVAKTGSTITLDGQAVTGFTPVGATGYGVKKTTVSNAGNGNHTITGSAEFGITVYGYGQYTSYWYPGGLNLQKL